MITTIQEYKPIITQIVINGQKYTKEQLLEGLSHTTPEQIGLYVINRIKNDKFDNLLEEMIAEIAKA